MPIFHDPYDSPPRQSSSRQTSFGGRTADSPSVEPDTLQLDASKYWCSAGLATQSKMNPELHESDRKHINLGRVELIERLKRSKSPIWQQSLDVRHLPLYYETIVFVS